MKRKLTLSKLLLLSAYVLFVMSISSCKKDDQNNFDGTVTAKVNLVNTSPDAGSVSMYIAGTIRTPSPVAYGTASGYNQTYVGPQTVEIKSASSNSTVASSTQQIDANTSYTAFLIGQGTNLSMVFAKDDTKAPSAGKAKIRFVNGSSGLATADLYLNTTKVIGDQAFRSASDYIEVVPASVVLLVNSGGKTVATGTVSLTEGKIYNVFVKGTAGATGTAALGVATVEQK